jgi:hypothetical protein
MAAVKLEIELDPGPWDDPEWADYRAVGGTVSGRVKTITDDPISCRRLVVSVGWHTEGRGDKDQEAVGEETVFEGELQPDQPSFPFSFPLPAGPVSYAGHYINIVWQVSANLDLAWKRDPHTEQTFFLTLP